MTAGVVCFRSLYSSPEQDNPMTLNTFMLSGLEYSGIIKWCNFLQFLFHRFAHIQSVDEY